MKCIPIFALILVVLSISLSAQQRKPTESSRSGRKRVSINDGWLFFKYNSTSSPDTLIYDVRPAIIDKKENRVADAKPTEASKVVATQQVLKSWILPSANRFIKNPDDHHVRPSGNPGHNFPFVQTDFDDSAWKKINLPHDWAIQGPFMSGQAEVGGGMGRLPVQGVGLYRKKIDIPLADKDKSVFLEVDGAMSYAMVWFNGVLVGGWPYGYTSWRLDLTPYLRPGSENQLAIRLDNPNYSSRWYPGAGIYRNVWLIKTNRVHVAQSGTHVMTKDISKAAATVDMEITLDNDSEAQASVDVLTSVFLLDANGKKKEKAEANFPTLHAAVPPRSSTTSRNAITISNPTLWGPRPTQRPGLYVAVTLLKMNGEIIDTYETTFGVRSVDYHAEKGLMINGEHIVIKGVNQHHDLGALGTAFNIHAAHRQLLMLREMGCNAIRMSHNPPAPELLDLIDSMGFLVVDELFDSWALKKNPHDFRLIFEDWSEPDARAFIRRDRNHPSVIMWSIGNEVGEQYTDQDGAAVASRLRSIVREEDITRPVTSAMNYAKPDMALPAVLDVISLNYQGEGIRQAAEFEGTERIRTAPQYDAYHKKYPQKLIVSSETASAFSSRGVYLFPVSPDASSPVRDGRGGDSKINQVSGYELYAVDFGSSADKVFSSLQRHPFVAGEFVWTGWDHLGEPTPYYDARSSYAGIIDLAGFKKDRFYLYQSQWRPDLPMTHILPHWNWTERLNQITPVHVFTSGDEAELFLNGVSLGRKKMGTYEYRLRWDSVRYSPGELKVVSYKNGKPWSTAISRTTGKVSGLRATANNGTIHAEGKDLSFITIALTDKNGMVVPRSNNEIEFSIDGPGEIVATDNGDPTSMISFASHQRRAFNGLCLVIVRATGSGPISVHAKSPGRAATKIAIHSEK